MNTTAAFDNAMRVNLDRLYSSYGYRRFRMSKFEEYDLYRQNKNFLVSNSVITFTDTNGRLLALKPDVTLSIVKSLPPAGEGRVHRVFYSEQVYRPSRGDGTFCEITQIGLECIGDVDDYCLSEALGLAAKTLAVAADDYILDISDLSLVSGAMERVGMPDSLRGDAIKLFGEKNRHELKELCARAGLTDDMTDRITALSDIGDEPDKALPVLCDLFSDDEWKQSTRRLADILSVVPARHVRVDFSVVNNLNYYNGIVFQGYINGIAEHVLSGGQYDLLLSRMNKSGKAVGFALYPDKLDLMNRRTAEYDADVLLLYSERNTPAQIARAVEAMTRDGLSVVASRCDRPDGSYKKNVRLSDGGDFTLC